MTNISNGAGKKKKIIKTATVKHPTPMSKSETLFSEQFVMENLYKSMYITKRSLQREGEFAGKLMQWIHRKKEEKKAEF